MKKTVKLLVGVMALSVAAVGCTDLTVEETDSTFVDEGGSGGGGDPADLLQTNYNDLGAVTDQANIYSLHNHTSDEMIPPTRGVDWGDNGVWRTLHAHTWDPAHSYVTGSWNQLNERVFRASQTLDAGPSAQQAAEAKVLRAYFMHQILDFWGVVPFREVDEGPEIDPRVLTAQEAFDFILNDLESSVADLPTIGPGAQNHQVSKAFANFLIAKMYLNKAVYTLSPTDRAAGGYTFDNADMDAVIAAVDAIEADGYSLDPDYFNIFHPTTSASEGIMHSPSGSPANRMYMTTHYSQNPSGWNGFTTLADFYNVAAADANDQRLGFGPGTTGFDVNGWTFTGDNATGIGYGFLIGQQYNDDGTETIDSRSQNPLSFTPDVPLAGASTDKGIRIMKYHPSSSDFGTQNYIIARYGDAFLMRAEALLRKGDAPGASTEVDELRTARGAALLSGNIDLAGMLDERGKELYWEGVRRTDQIRFETFTSTWSEKSVTDADKVVFPIPAVALGSNPNLTQNPGY